MFTRFIKEVNIPKMNETLIQIEKDLLVSFIFWDFIVLFK